MNKHKSIPIQDRPLDADDKSDKMIALVEAHDWSGTSLGEMSEWHPVVDNTVSLCLHARSPMLLLWGPDMIQIYNDAYRDIIGQKHNSIGHQASEVWSGIWSEIAPLLQSVLRDGIAVHKENSKFILDRKGYPEECYFTFSYNPIFLSPGIVGGIMVLVQETTQTILSGQKLTALRDEQIRNLFVQAPIALCILKGKDFVVEVANDRMLSLWGRTQEEVLNKPLFEGVPAAKNQGFESLLGKVFQNGERAVIEETTLDLHRGNGSETIYIKFVYEPLRDFNGEITGIMGLADEITDQVLARKRIEESDIRQKIAIDAAAIGTFEWNILESSFKYSDRLAQIFGFVNNETSLLQSDFGSRIHPEDQAHRLAAHQQAFENGVLFYEARIILPDETIRWVRLNGKVIYNIHGKPARMYGTTLDITEQRNQAERLERTVEQRTQILQERNTQLQRSEERYHRMIDEIQDYAIILLDRDGFIQNWNKGAEKIKQYHESEIIGKNFRIFYLPEDRENKLPERLIHDAATYGRATHEGWRLRKDGSKFWGSIAITALHNSQQEVIGFSKVTRDLTERKLAEDKLKAYTVELEAQNRELEQFAYVASHDLQEPLRKIQTFCEVIQKNNHDEATSRRYFPKIISAAQRMTELIKSVLNYSRLSREGTFVTVDLNAILANILNDYELLISEKAADVQYEIMPEIKGIPLQISQLFSNLIGNALKFTLENPIVSIRSRVVPGEEIGDLPVSVPEKNYLEISVADNGIGFDQKYEKLIFAMFQRLNSKHEYAGTGIGLALCKKIIENHNGFITAKSEPGKGSTFLVYLPFN